jgi:hypothetical protein
MCVLFPPPFLLEEKGFARTRSFTDKPQLRGVYLHSGAGVDTGKSAIPWPVWVPAYMAFQNVHLDVSTVYTWTPACTYGCAPCFNVHARLAVRRVRRVSGQCVLPDPSM